jgi:hypothetical protein
MQPEDIIEGLVFMPNTNQNSEISKLEEICFESYNPYLGLPQIPNITRIVSRDTLEIIKILRNDGYDVKIMPDDGSKIHYTVEKGINELLANPIFVFVVNIPISIITGIAGSWLYDRMKNKKEYKKIPEKSGFVIETNESGTTMRYDSWGNPVSEEKFEQLLSVMNENRKNWIEARKIKSPDLSLPYPIFMKHTPRIIGWCDLKMKDTGIHADPIKIIDEEAMIKIRLGDLKGISFGGVIHSSECSICGNQYTECNHISGKEYAEGECITKIDGVYFAEFSLVKDPIQPLAILNQHSGNMSSLQSRMRESKNIELASTLKITRKS